MMASELPAATLCQHRSRYAGRGVLVTGGAGAIGSNLCAALGELGAHVTILDDLSAAYRWNVPVHPNIVLVQGSITDEEMLERVFADDPRIVFHLAAFFANQNSVEHPERDLHTNGLGTLRLLEHSRVAAVDRFVYASSGGAIYGSQAPLPLTEASMSLHLSSPYQITKMLGELYANFFQHHYDLDVAKPRLFNSYGPGEVPGPYRNVIPNFIFWAMKGRPLPVTGAGDETRDFTYVTDIVDGLLRAGVLREASGEEFNLASGSETRIVDLALMVNEAVGNRAGIVFAPRRHWDTKPRRLASIDRAQELLSYEPSMPFDAGLQRTIEWFRANWDAIEAEAPFGDAQHKSVQGSSSTGRRRGRRLSTLLNGKSSAMSS
jgi:UDP-glucose 4-epimerase